MFKYTVEKDGTIGFTGPFLPFGEFTRFKNQYKLKSWVMKENFRDPMEMVYASDIVKYQYMKIAKEEGFYGFMPEVIIRDSVINRTTISLTENLSLRKLADVFFNQTDNGKSTQRILHVFKLKALSVERKINERYKDRADFVVRVTRIRRASTSW